MRHTRVQLCFPLYSLPIPSPQLSITHLSRSVLQGHAGPPYSKFPSTATSSRVSPHTAFDALVIIVLSTDLLTPHTAFDALVITVLSTDVLTFA